MATAEDVKKLAALARIRVEDSELKKFTGEFDAILAYVGQLEKLELPIGEGTKPALRNVMREDSEPHDAGIFTEKLAAQFPSFAEATEGKQASEAGVYLEVKQIISHE